MADVKKIIKDLGATNWSSDNAAQMKAVQLLKGLALSDEELSNKFMAAVDKATTSIAKNLVGEQDVKPDRKEIEKDDEKDRDEIETDDEKEKLKKDEKKGKKTNEGLINRASEMLI